MIKAVIAHSGETSQGRTYSSDLIREIVRQVNENPGRIPVQKAQLDQVSLYDTVGFLQKAEYREAEGRSEAVVEVRFIPPQDQIMEELLEPDIASSYPISIAMSGAGNIDEQGSVRDYVLDFTFLTPSVDHTMKHCRLWKEKGNGLL